MVPYGSTGNGSAMRVCPIGVLFTDYKDILKNAYKSAVCSHNSFEGIKGTCVTTMCIYLAKYGTKKDVEKYLIEQYQNEKYLYHSDLPFSKMKKIHLGNPVLCETFVPYAIRCALDTLSYEEFLRTLNIEGKDSDTEAVIGGPISYLLNPNWNLSSDELIEQYLDQPMLEILNKIN